MTINAVTSAGGSVPFITPKKTDPVKELDSSHFMQLILKQLSNQNPLDPVSDKEFMGQMAQMNSLQELQKMNATLEKLVGGNDLSKAAGLIGREVKAVLADGSTLKSGVVTGVLLDNNQVMLQLGEEQVPLSTLVSVSAAGASIYA